MKDEIWKDVVGYEGRYQVSNKGRLRTLNYPHYGKIMSDKTDNGNGYMINGLFAEGEKTARTSYRHRLVAQAFLDNPDGLPQVGHKDDDKSNNAVENLYWCEGSQNIRDAHKTGRMKKRSEHGSTVRLPDDIVAMAYRAVKMNMMGVAEAARFFGMPRTTMSSIINKRGRISLTDSVDREFQEFA